MEAKLVISVGRGETFIIVTVLYVLGYVSLCLDSLHCTRCEHILYLPSGNHCNRKRHQPNRFRFCLLRSFPLRLGVRSPAES